MAPPLINPALNLEWLLQNTSGKGVDVAVIDSGIDPCHPDLAGRIVRSCVVESDAVHGAMACREIDTHQSSDSFGHGTAVAGVIAAIAPQAGIISVKVLNQYNAFTGEAIIEGIRWALDQRIKLINISLGVIKKQWVPALFELCERAYEQETIMVVSKKNFGPPGWPAAFSSVISVDRAEFADRYDFAFNNKSLIEFDANGSEITVAVPGGGYAIQTGTSFATPVITALTALMLEHYPGLLCVEAKSFLKAIAIEWR